MFSQKNLINNVNNEKGRYGFLPDSITALFPFYVDRAGLPGGQSRPHAQDFLTDGVVYSRNLPPALSHFQKGAVACFVTGNGLRHQQNLNEVHLTFESIRIFQCPLPSGTGLCYNPFKKSEFMEANMETKMVFDHKNLNRDVIKYIAMLTMLLNHISQIFMKPGYFLSELFLDIGYFTAITMCYFLVEGFQYTHSKKNYAIRLLIFALISEIPYCMAFTNNGVIEFQGLNMLFTLLLCFAILIVNEKVLNKFLKGICILGLIVLSVFCDWALLAPIFTLLFIWSRRSRNKIKCTFIISMLLFGIFNFAGGIGRFSAGKNIVYALGSMSGIALAGIVILYFYNGKRMEKGKVFSKWFFYLFYPVHLLILGLIRIYCL